MDYVFLFVLFLLPGTTQTKRGKRASNKGHLCFPVIGDMGGLPYPPFQTPTQKDVAALLAKVNSQLKCKFIVGVGDNFYYNGVTNAFDPRFYLTFERTYSALDLPWYMIAGNHDHYGNVTAQIGYSKMSKRWKFPFFYYSEVHSIPESKKTVEVVMIDTTMLCWHTRKSGAPPPETQMEWITKKLSESVADYLIVAGHHPILSAGIHGSTDCLINKLKPLLEKYKVSAYFSGHDHNLQHIKEKDSDVHYFVTGSGNFVDGRMLNKGKLPNNSLKFENGIFGGFALLRASDKYLKVQILNSEPKELWRLKIFPRNSPNDKTESSRYDNSSGIDFMKNDRINLTDSLSSMTNLYEQIYPMNYGNSFLQMTPNPYFYNNWFFPRQMTPNFNLNYIPKFDLMQFANTRDSLLHGDEMFNNPMMSSINNAEQENSFNYMKNYYLAQNNPVTKSSLFPLPQTTKKSDVDTTKQGINWLMKELNETESVLKKRSYDKELTPQEKRKIDRLRKNRSSQLLNRILRTL